jgi:hypothetical protein
VTDLFSHKCRQCFLDESAKVAVSLTCPSCSHSIASMPSSEEPQILTRYINEGGQQDSLNVFPLVKEEAYLDAHPAARPARAFLTMCAEGDVAGIVELLGSQGGDDGDVDDDDMEGDSMPPAEILRYQDPLGGGKSALHIAIEQSQLEVVWLLLWLASHLKTNIFPEEVAEAAQLLGADRETAEDGPDIRSLRDANNRTADDVAGSIGGMWGLFLHEGVLRS